MFIRTKTTPNSPRKSVQIVESIRDAGKIKQKIVRHVGIAMDDHELNELLKLAHHIKCKIEEEHAPTLFGVEKMHQFSNDALQNRPCSDDPIIVNLKELEEVQRSIVGIHQVYGQIYDQLGFNHILSSTRRGQPADNILKNIVMARIANPASKRASVINLEEDFGVGLNLQGVYRMMEKIDESVIREIEKCAYISTQGMLGGKIDVIFVDATTLYFESFIEDEFKQNGYSKDLKFSQPQVLLALMVTKQGLPVGYQAFPGATYEGHTLTLMLKSMREKFDLDKVIFVGDSGLFNGDNLEALETNKFEYIVGARLRNMKKTLKEKILNQAEYTNLFQCDKDSVRVASFDFGNNRTLIVSHSAKRARKDAHDREKAVLKLKEKLSKSKDPNQLISNYGYKKYLKIEGETTVNFNEAKLAKEAEWDGLHGMVTNTKDLSPEEILAQYKGLWQVEESFRINKHDMKIRPIFHWTPQKIKAHLAISFMAFTCVRNLEYRVGVQYKKMSPEAIRGNLCRVQVSLLRDRQGKRYIVPSNASQDARKIYQIMGIKYSVQPYRQDPIPSVPCSA